MHRTTQWHPKPGKSTRTTWKRGNGGMRSRLLDSAGLIRPISHPLACGLYRRTESVDCSPCAQSTASMGAKGACYQLRTPVRRGSKIRVRCAIAWGEMERLRVEADEARRHTTLTMLENYSLRADLIKAQDAQSNCEVRGDA